MILTRAGVANIVKIVGNIYCGVIDSSRVVGRIEQAIGAVVHVERGKQMVGLDLFSRNVTVCVLRVLRDPQLV